MAWLPLVGIVVGLAAGALGWGASAILPHPLGAVTAFAAALVLTGALHLDGFLDSCDALFASVPPAQRLDILRDPRHGSYALAGFAIAVPLALAALAALPPWQLPWALAFTGGTARFAAVLSAFWFPYGRAGASAQAFERRPSATILAGCALAAVACAWIAPIWIPLMALAAVASLGIGTFAARRLGGALTGDVYGAAIVTIEVLLLVALAGLTAAR